MTEAPWFEDFKVGDDFSDVPAVTVTEGYTAIHQAITGDRLRLPLDHQLSNQVTGVNAALVNPSLVCNLAIGQTTIPSQRVMGNLFYRGLLFRQPVHVGDTLRTTTRVVALKQNKPKPGRAASGMVALEMHVRNQRDETVILFWRCPMIPCKNPEAITDHADDFSIMPEVISDDELVASVPKWRYEAFRAQCPGIHFENLQTGQEIDVEARDTVTLAPELVRLTLNMAMTHTDATRSVYGKRLVYGGHTISIAAAQLSRAIPNLLTILGWFKCDHTAPVFEEDILRSRVIVERKLKASDAGIVILSVQTFAFRATDELAEGDHDTTNGDAWIKVLDWQLAALMA